MERTVVLHLMNNFEDASISRIVYQLVRHIGVDNFDWHIGGLNSNGQMTEVYQHQGAKIADFSPETSNGEKTTSRIRDYLKKHQVKIVHTHTPRTLLAAARALHTGDYAGVKHVATKHILSAPKDRKWGLIYTLLDRFTLYMPDYLVCVSKKIRDEITKIPGIDSHYVTLISNSIDCEYFYKPDLRNSCRSEFSVSPDQVVIGSSGRLDIVKRYDLLLEGFATVLERYPAARLMIVGEGALRAQLEELSTKLGIAPAVIFTGYRQDIPRLLAAMDIYIQPSVNEGLSLSILEAMAAAKPVIITDVGGAREIVENGLTGIIIPPLSVEAISRSLSQLLEKEEKRTALAEAAKSYICKEYNIERMTESYHTLYRSIRGPSHQV